MSQVPPPPSYPGSPQMAGYNPPGGAKPTSGLAIGSLICGIISVVLFCAWFIAAPLGLAAVIMGIIAKGKINRGEAGGNGLAMTGIITGIMGILISVGIVVSAVIWGEELQKKAMELQERSQQQIQDTAPADPAQ